MKTERYRKFRCGQCGWESSSFGSRYHIDSEQLKVAQKELDDHLKTHPATYHQPGCWKLEVVYG